MIVKKVKIEFDQIDVAVLIAPAVGNFTCAYIVALVRTVYDWMITQFVVTEFRAKQRSLFSDCQE